MREFPPVFLDRLRQVTPLVTCGEFRCTPAHSRFEDSGPIRQDCFVFPRLAVAIAHERERRFVANPNVVTFYNTGQAYRRLAISPLGDHCDWFAVDRQVVGDIVEAAGGNSEASRGPFRWVRGPADAAVYLAQRELVDALADGRVTHAADVEERVIHLLDRVVRRALRPTGVSAKAPGSEARAAVDRVEAILSARWREPLSLRDLAREAGVSVFHLCRAFRTCTGRPMYQYRQQLRLRSALDLVRDTTRPLVDIALDAGFSSHSHFTASFRRAFGVTPQWLRRTGPAAGATAGRCRVAEVAQTFRPARPPRQG